MAVPNPASGPKRMLIIDDEKNLLMGLKAVMIQAGFEVYTTQMGAEGIKIAREQLPDIIICDVMMPTPNGFQVKEILANDKTTATIPFIFLTARTAQVYKVAGLQQGADDYVTKPFNPEELIARAHAVLRRNEIGRQKGIQEMENALEKVRRTIATNLGHELRTPLGIVLASLDMAMREKFQGKVDELDWYLEASLNSAQKLSMLVSDLIILDEIDQGRVNKLRRLVDLDFNFKDPIETVVARYADKKLDVKTIIHPNVVIHGPEHEFTHVVSHLVDNACKFSHRGAKIWIELKPNGLGGCILTVENEGPKIPLELQEKVFERYYQIHQGNTRAHGGLGVGLPIVRAVAKACGGSAVLQDSAVGCKVSVVFPPGPIDWEVN